MKAFIIFLFSFSFCLLSYSQSTFEVFSEDGEKFFVILNGQRQNDQPQFRVKVDDLHKHTEYLVVIVFENEKIQNCRNYILLVDEKGDFTHKRYVLEKDRDANYNLKALSSTTVSNNQPVSGESISKENLKTLINANPTKYLKLTYDYSQGYVCAENITISLLNISQYDFQYVILKIDFIGNFLGTLYCTKNETYSNILKNQPKPYIFKYTEKCNGGKLLQVSIVEIIPL
jgi:hypothetical protein